MLPLYIQQGWNYRNSDTHQMCCSLDSDVKARPTHLVALPHDAGEACSTEDGVATRNDGNAFGPLHADDAQVILLMLLPRRGLMLL